MRLLVLALALLAGSKVWFQESQFRAGAEAAIVAAYRGRAVEACSKAPALAAQGYARSVLAVDWTRPSEVSLSAGNRSVPVQFWQFEHPLWNARFKNPYLILTPPDQQAGLVCKFDVLSGEAGLELL